MSSLRSSRYHPYTLHPHPQHSPRNHPTPIAKSRPAAPAPGNTEPPTPPRSRRDPSETPSVSLSAAFGGSPGGKWWEEELPPPPASLNSILDSFRKSGEGDRELLLSILAAKKAEEERLSAMIQTRLTILQARLSLHQAALSMPSVPVAPSIPAAEHHPRPPSETDLRATSPERTPSLTSRDSASASSERVVSPPGGNEYMLPPPVRYGYAGEKDKAPVPMDEGRPRYWHLPAGASRERPPLRDLAEARSLSPREVGGRDRSGSGLEMLLDVGMRGLEDERAR
ncbi:hypothetical protein IAR50_006002 [Cryptococcus sp. DSM 104548]